MTVVMMLSIAGMLAAAPISDVIQYPTGNFVPDQGSTYDDPYYRWFDGDWGWQHTAIDPTGAATASLYIAAWDVDASSGEVDVIKLWDGTSYVQLGTLAGLDDDWGYTTFDLDLGTWGAQIASGLQVWMDIDSTHDSDFWAVTLSKSVLSLDNGVIPDPDPNPVPEPASLLLLGAGLVGLAGLKRKMGK